MGKAGKVEGGFHCVESLSDEPTRVSRRYAEANIGNIGVKIGVPCAIAGKYILIHLTLRCVQ
jgi:hypothetical protein